MDSFKAEWLVTWCTDVVQEVFAHFQRILSIHQHTEFEAAQMADYWVARMWRLYDMRVGEFDPPQHLPQIGGLMLIFLMERDEFVLAIGAKY